MYITAAVTESAHPEASLLATNILVGGLSLFKGSTGVKVFKKSITDIVETILYFNLLALAAFSQYDFKTDTTKRKVVAYISTIIIFLLLTGVIAYNVYLLFAKEKTTVTVELKKYLQAPLLKNEVTYSVIEIPKPQCPQPEAAGGEEELVPATIDSSLLTLPYHAAID